MGMAELAALFYELLRRRGGTLGLFFRLAGSTLKRRVGQAAVVEIFPLPWLSHGPGGAQRPLSEVPAEVLWTNIWVGLLNQLYCAAWSGPAVFQASAAQERLLRSLRGRAAHLLRQCAGVDLDGGEIRACLRLHLDDYRDVGGVLPLGLRVGLPAEAAKVDVACALREWDPRVAAICDDPAELLLGEGDRPTVGRHRCVQLAADYPNLVDRSVDAGLQELVAEDGLPTLGGSPVWNGGFAVPKDEREDRWIAPLEWTNDCVDDQRVPKVNFPYLPQLRTLTIPKYAAGKRVRSKVSKRDGRH